MLATLRVRPHTGQPHSHTLDAAAGLGQRRCPHQVAREQLELRALALGCQFDLAQVAADRWLRREVR